MNVLRIPFDDNSMLPCCCRTANAALHPPTDDRIGGVREAAKIAGSNARSDRWHRIEFN